MALLMASARHGDYVTTKNIDGSLGNHHTYNPHLQNRPTVLNKYDVFSDTIHDYAD